MHFVVNDIKYKHVDDLIISEIDDDENVIYLVCKEERLDFNMYDIYCDYPEVPVRLIYYYNMVTNNNKFIDNKVWMPYNFVYKHILHTTCYIECVKDMNIYEYDARNYYDMRHHINKIETYYLIRSIDCEIVIDDDIKYKKHHFSDATLIIIEADKITEKIKICGSIKSRKYIEIFVYYQFDL